MLSALPSIPCSNNRLSRQTLTADCHLGPENQSNCWFIQHSQYWSHSHSLRIPFAPVRICNFRNSVFSGIPNSIGSLAPAGAAASYPSNWTSKMSDSWDKTLNPDQRNSRFHVRSAPALLGTTLPHSHWKFQIRIQLPLPESITMPFLTVYPA